RAKRLARRFSMEFFLQAEDGIRVLTVTGVQTCALPILASATSKTSRRIARNRSIEGTPAVRYATIAGRPARLGASSTSAIRAARSEERRVGKDWRCRWAQDGSKVRPCGAAASRRVGRDR